MSRKSLYVRVGVLFTSDVLSKLPLCVICLFENVFKIHVDFFECLFKGKMRVRTHNGQNFQYKTIFGR